ncbi:MAG: hypothetical protein P8M49_07820, partial [Thalassotalea sp.]|nr:hypothetical protein [Thalassotalea sp.]
GGGGGGDSTPEPPANVAPTVSISGANQSLEKETVAMAANASDLDGSIASYAWSVDNASVALTGADSANISLIAPSVEEDLEFTVSLTVTDDDGATATSSMVFTSKPIKAELYIQGLVKDDVIHYADVTLEVGDESFNVISDSLGTYGFELVVDERNFDKLIKITALGTEAKHQGVKLISLLESFNTVKAEETSREFVLANNYFGVNVTNVTTAEYALLIKLNGGNEITTEARLDELKKMLLGDFSQVQELAAVLKVVIDNPDYVLPETVADTLALLNNNEVYSQLLNDINTASSELIQETILEIWSDHELVEFPDTDGDGILNICDLAAPTANTCDPDLDNDLVPNEQDFYPLDKSKYAPKISMLDFRNDPEKNWSRFKECISYNGWKNNGYNTSEFEDASVLEFTELDCTLFPQITNTDNLQHFTNLTSITFNNTNVSDLSVLSALTNLQSLSLISLADVTDFEFIKSLNNLEKLDLSGTQFKNIADLVELTNLTSLNLAATSVDDLASLSSLVNLTSLDVSNTNVVDLSFTESMPELSSLYAHSSKVAILPDLAKLSKLNDISLYDNAIVDISSLANLAAYKTLDLHGNDIVSVSALSSLTSLNSLDLSDNKITSMAGIETLTSLTSLNLKINPINDFTALNALEKLEALNLSETGIIDVSILNDAAPLTYLNIANNTVSETVVDPLTDVETVTVISSLSDVSSLGVYADLTTLVANNNAIINISALSTLSSIQTLNIEHNAIADITAVTSLLSLEKLYLNSNNISNVTPLLNMAALPKTLQVSGNPINCEQNVLLIAKADLDDTDYTGIEECIALIKRDAITAKKVSEIFKLPQDDNPRSGGFANLGEIDMISCISGVWNGYPLCWESNGTTSAEPTCSAEQDATQMVCKDSGGSGYEYPLNSGQFWHTTEWSLEYDSSIAANNVFRDSFDRRLILTILRTSYANIHDANGEEFNFCPPIGEGKYECTITGVHFEDPSGELSWIQNFPEAHFPRCSAEAGSSIATCTPGISPEELVRAAIADEAPKVDDSQSFEIDFSKIRVIPLAEREVPEACVPGEDQIC